MGFVGPLRKNLTFSVSLGMAKILKIVKLSAYIYVCLPETFWSSLNHACISNNEEGMKFYDLRDQSFETDVICYFYILAHNFLHILAVL